MQPRFQCPARDGRYRYQPILVTGGGKEAGTMDRQFKGKQNKSAARHISEGMAKVIAAAASAALRENHSTLGSHERANAPQV